MSASESSSSSKSKSSVGGGGGGGDDTAAAPSVNGEAAAPATPSSNVAVAQISEFRLSFCTNREKSHLGLGRLWTGAAEIRCQF